jgi:hypothetical protein
MGSAFAKVSHIKSSSSFYADKNINPDGSFVINRPYILRADQKYFFAAVDNKIYRDNACKALGFQSAFEEFYEAGKYDYSAAYFNQNGEYVDTIAENNLEQITCINSAPKQVTAFEEIKENPDGSLKVIAPYTLRAGAKYSFAALDNELYQHNACKALGFSSAFAGYYTAGKYDYSAAYFNDKGVFTDVIAENKLDSITCLSSNPVQVIVDADGIKYIKQKGRPVQIID